LTKKATSQDDQTFMMSSDIFYKGSWSLN